MRDRPGVSGRDLPPPDFSRLLVCGDREWTARGAMWNVLDALRNGHSLTIIEGAARGADTAARDWALGNLTCGVDLIEKPANWVRFGKAAGPIRNREMLKARPTFVLAFHNGIEQSKGTADMLTLAADNDVPYALLTETDCA